MKLRKAFALLAVAWSFALVACGSSSTAATSPAPSSASATPSSTASPTATTLDPCQLVTSQEASTLAGATYGAGKPETYSSGSKGCIYGYQTTNVFTVIVATAADPATAQAAWAQELANAQDLLAQAFGSATSISVNTNDVTVAGADRAAVGAGTFPLAGNTLGISAMYLLKGANFVTFSDLVVGQAGPSTSSMETQAATVIGRLP